MARTGTRQRAGRGAPVRRKWVWERFEAISTLTAGQVIRFNLLEAFETRMGADLIGITASRVRGRAAILATGTGPEAVRLAAVVGPEGDVLGQATDGPYNRPYDDYFLWEPLCWIGSGATAVSGRMIDVQSMRKVDELDQQLQLFAAANPGNTVTVTIALDWSVGIKLA